MNFTIEHEREDDGRWLAEVPELPGVLAYGATAAEAMAKVKEGQCNFFVILGAPVRRRAAAAKAGGRQ
ncbi:MAG: hypothetical protein A3F74_02830 [Betaproteobacteria bacterium RIFCSPLOWO2_12_FULL_62_58]|nr:MAG: hypothetical protein A3F74_02830 [Betaproteobacteria bacterium RIFCSPLOWO2_12_FULL_62_58]